VEIGRRVPSVKTALLSKNYKGMLHADLISPKYDYLLVYHGVVGGGKLETF